MVVCFFIASIKLSVDRNLCRDSLVKGLIMLVKSFESWYVGDPQYEYFFCLRCMVAPQYGVQWLPDIPASPRRSVVHLKRGSNSSSKITEESKFAAYIHKE